MIWWSQNSRRSECIYIRRRGVQCVGWILHRICSAQHIMIRQLYVLLANRAKDICARDMRWMFKMYIVSVWECVPGGKVEQGCSVWGRRLFSAALTHHTCILLIGGETTTTTYTNNRLRDLATVYHARGETAIRRCILMRTCFLEWTTFQRLETHTDRYICMCVFDGFLCYRSRAPRSISKRLMERKRVILRLCDAHMHGFRRSI